jgi:hypothetical protein
VTETLKQKNCKICRSLVSQGMLYAHHCMHKSYLELIEIYEKEIPCLNLYNISTHFNRHVEMKDIREVEALKEQYEPD